MLDWKRLIDKSRAQGAIITIAILVEAIGVSLVTLAVFMIHREKDGTSAPPPPLTPPAPPVHLHEGEGASLVILIAMIILFGAATYFTGQQYGKAGTITVIAGFVIVFIGLALSGLNFG